MIVAIVMPLIFGGIFGPVIHGAFMARKAKGWH